MRISLLAFLLTVSLVGSVRAGCPVGDLTGDCDVNFPDLKIFVDQWLDPPGCLAHPNDCADLDDVNGVNMADFALLAANWLIKTGSLQVTILPPEAVAAGAQWRVDGGNWQDSGYTETCVTVGTHTVEYKPISDWNEPNAHTVQINEGQTTATSGTYTRQTGSLQVTISPQEAVDAGAQWRVDGGTWRDSGYIESSLTVGTHTVEYSAVAGWNKPSDEVVQINNGQTTTTGGTYTQQTGSLQVTISPQAAIDAGAQWRVDNRKWRDSGYIETDLSVGSHTVRYKDISGWNTPADEIVQINDGQTTTTSGTYTQQTGSLQVTISPQAAIDAGAQWRVDGGTWRDSGYTESGLPVGSHTVEYNVVTGWNKPSDEIVQINGGQTTTTTGTYTAQSGSLQVTILPPEAVTAGAQWRVDGGTWRDSGYTESGLPVGSHTVEYNVVAGWNKPDDGIVQINDGQTTTTSGTYTAQSGSLQVTILPPEAVTAGAQWRVDGGTWRDSGYTESGLPVGSHTVEYRVVTGWSKPADEEIQINDGQTTATTGTYTQQTGSLQVTISPQAAIDAGAQWRVDGGTWRDSGYTEAGLTVGSHTVEYNVISGWTKPADEVVQINDGQTTTTTGTYTAQSGSLQITILPPEAVTAGAQWRVDGGTWRDSGYTEAGLTVGSHTVEYNVVSGWNKPSDEVVQISDGQTTITSGTYTAQSGSLQVTILPPEADAAGAQWRVDGGIWRESNEIESGLAVGSHTVEYMPIVGWNRPANEIVQISDGQTTTTTGTYIQQIGSLQVTISPQGAIDAGAQWRVDGGTWRDSNYIETGLLVGFYTVEFSIIDGWNTPAAQMVQINDNQTTTTSGAYIQQIYAQLKINEFMASNSSVEPLEEGELLDGDGLSSDWLEIYNPTDVTVDLDGWYLTDSEGNLVKWQFPDGLQIVAGGFLIIFASEKLNYPYLDPAGYYHTNFELNQEGDYLALVAPDGNTVVHEYEPEYPDQLANISYGLAHYAEMLVPTGATATYHVPTISDAALGTTWTSSDFDDSEWETGPTGLGFGSSIVETGQDIGTPSAAGSYSVDNGVYTVEGDGEDIWSGPSTIGDDFYYVYTPLSGDGEIIARVISIEKTNNWAKAGVMIREDLTGTSSHAMMIATPPNGADEYAFQWVDGTDRDNNLQGGDVMLPSWLKIERIGDDFTGYYAPDIGGSPGEWVQMGTTSIDMVENVYIGLCVTSRTDGVLCTAVFDNVTCSGRISTDLQDEMLGINASLWTRIEFYLDEDQRGLFDTFILRMKYEDGFVAYLNGQEVASCNAPSTVEWNSTALCDRPIEDSLVFKEINIMAFLGTLRIGKNVLAIHGLNDEAADDEFLILPELLAASSIDVPQYFATATPGTLNVADTKGIVSEVWFSHERGYYDTGFRLILSTAMEDAEIRYTTDGSCPTITNGLTYTGPFDVNQTTTVRAVAVKPGWLPSNAVAHTYIFLYDVANQPKFPPGFPTSWAGYTADYEVDPEVVNNTLPGYSFEEALLWIPSVCITMLTDDLFGADDGIYVYSTSKGDEWERPASIELIYPDGRDGFQINAGVHLHGGASRNHSSTLKHSFRLVFRGIYGPTKLNFPLFPDSDVEQFDQLVLRGSSGDSWTYPDSYRDGVIRHIKIQAQYTRDPWMKDTQRAMGHHSAHSIFVHLYLNGLYWGQYNLCERPNSSFQASYYGGDKEDYDAIHDYDELQSGTWDVWNQLFDLAAAGLSSDEDAQFIQGNNADGARNPNYPILLNVDNLIDYMILHHFARSEDWPCHNFWGARRRGPLSEGFRFFVWDQENHNNTLERFVTGCGCHIEILPGEEKRSLRPGYLYAKLRDNPMFRRKFSDRVHKHMFNGGLLTIEKVEERWMKRATEVDKSVVAESARWGDAKRTVPYTREVEFLTEQNRLHTEYWPQISAIVLDRYRGVGLYPDISAPVFRIDGVYQHGGQISSTDELTMDNLNGSGTIYYTTDGNDPRLPVSTQIDGTILVAEGAEKRVLVPTGSINDNWKGGGPFNDSGWNDGTFIAGKIGGVGYDERTDYKPYISYDVEALMNSDLNPGANTSCYIRIPFTLDIDPCDFNFMVLKIRYDDGFVAYLNGDELKRINFPEGETPLWNSNASGGHEASGLETIPVSDDINSLQQGDNILAIHGMNNSNTSSDFLISVELVASDVNSTTGGVSPSAIKYNSEQITFNKSTHVKACVLDGTWSVLNEAIFAVGPVADYLRITEIMYHPKYTGNLNDPNEEFIELKNIGLDTLNLNLVRFTEGIHFTFPDIQLEAGEHVVVVKDRSAFEAQYGTSVNMAGEYSGSLANNGERIRLQDAVGQTILDFEYKDGWYPITDGDGFSLTIIDPTNSDPNSWSEKDSWRASVYRNGSPGSDDSGILPNPGAVVVNEVMSHSNAGPDWIELHNTTNEEINIGGWFLSDNDRDEPNLMKYRIADGTTIPLNGYIVFYQDTDFSNPGDPGCIVPFVLSENGEDVCLSSHLDPNGMLTGYRDVENFGASQTNVSFGRYFKSSTSTFNFVAMDSNTPNDDNADPKVGPVVINEIMYNPPSGNQNEEYIELHNITAAPVTLYRTDKLTPWKFTDGIDYTFSATSPYVTIPANGYLMIVKDKPAFITRYGSMPGGVQVLDDYDGFLSNAGERLQIGMPGDTDELGTRYYIRIDRVTYSDGSHPEDCPGGVDLWPTEADGLGKSLSRKVSADYGNDVANWEAAVPSPGVANP